MRSNPAKQRPDDAARQGGEQAAGTTTHPGPGSDLATQVAAIAPATICPSIPMFHKPAVKVTTKPVAASTSGTQAISVSETFAAEPKAPSQTSPTPRVGGTPAIASRTAPTRKRGDDRKGEPDDSLHELTPAPAHR